MKKNTVVLVLCVITACGPRLYQPATPVGYARHEVKPGSADSNLVQMLQPYAKAMQANMNVVIGNLSQTLEKKMPENSLGFFMTDAFLTQASLVFETRVDVALMNTGGIRTPAMQAGPIMVGTLYEAMPFDNLLVLLTLSGQQLQQLMNHVAGRGGWPISGGSYAIQNKKAVELMVGGVPIDLQKKYTVALSDYIANGGDDCSFLTGLPQQNKGYLQRDALIDFVKRQTAKGQPIALPSLQRLRYID
jgi:2',3'-cyclic-nucleotide 2'-phosphodiesterase (5'-nucleotidase family)